MTLCSTMRTTCSSSRRPSSTTPVWRPCTIRARRTTRPPTRRRSAPPALPCPTCRRRRAPGPADTRAAAPGLSAEARRPTDSSSETRTLSTGQSAAAWTSFLKRCYSNYKVSMSTATTCLDTREIREMSGNLTSVRVMSGKNLVGESSLGLHHCSVGGCRPFVAHF